MGVLGSASGPTVCVQRGEPQRATAARRKAEAKRALDKRYIHTEHVVAVPMSCCVPPRLLYVDAAGTSEGWCEPERRWARDKLEIARGYTTYNVSCTIHLASVLPARAGSTAVSAMCVAARASSQKPALSSSGAVTALSAAAPRSHSGAASRLSLGHAWWTRRVKPGYNGYMGC